MTAGSADPRLFVGKTGAAGVWEDFRRRLAQGDLGSLPVLLGLLAVVIYFQAQNDAFLSAANLTNLTLQIAAVATISVGVVLVLLLGEIDLSVGAVSGFAAACMAVLTTRHGVGAMLSIARGAPRRRGRRGAERVLGDPVPGAGVPRDPGRPAHLAGRPAARARPAGEHQHHQPRPRRRRQHVLRLDGDLDRSQR